MRIIIVCRFICLLLLLCIAPNASARLEVCNQTDLVLMVAVGYDTTAERTASEGWWRVYPGYCEVPVDVALREGSYYVHAESDPRSTMPGDAFSWGAEKKLCVETADFRIPNSQKECSSGKTLVDFNQLSKNWRNTNKIEVYASRRYQNLFRTKVAGIQRMLSILGHEVGDIDGVAGEKTVVALSIIGAANGVFGFDFDKMYPLLEQLIAQQQKLDN